MKFSRFVLAVAAAVVVAAPLATAEETATAEKSKVKAVDATGTWKWSDDQGNDHEMKIEKKEKDLLATYNGLLEDLKSKKVTLKGDKLVIEFEGEFSGSEFEATYEAIVKGDTVKGTLSLSSDQGTIDQDWEAKRSIELADLVGKWVLVVAADDGERELNFVISKKEKEISGVVNGEEIGECSVKDMKIKGNKLTFTINGELQGTEFEAECTTKVKGDKLDGAIALDLGGQVIEMPLTGKKSK